MLIIIIIFSAVIYDVSFLFYNVICLEIIFLVHKLSTSRPFCFYDPTIYVI